MLKVINHEKIGKHWSRGVGGRDVGIQEKGLVFDNGWRSKNLLSNCQGLHRNEEDIHIQESLVPFVKAEWVFDAFFSTFSNNSRHGGVMFLLNNNFEHTEERVQTYQNGNYIILDIAIQGKRITLANLYGPNDDKPQCFNNIREKCMAYDNDLTIYCGDWN